MNYTYCFDLGTDTVKICDINKKTVRIEKNAVAVKNKKELFAVGNTAYKMCAKSPNNINIVFPMKNGVIADSNYMAHMLEKISKFNKVKLFDKQLFLVSVPTDITDVQRRAFYKLIQNISKKTSGIGMIERPIADCVGLGVNINKTKGTFLVNLGADSTEISMLAKGGIFVTKLKKYGGNIIEEAIEDYIRKKYQLSIGMFDKSNLKKKLGNVLGPEDKNILVAGISVLTGRPDEVKIKGEDIYKCIKPYLNRVVDDMREVALKASPEIEKSVVENGVYITGGMSKLKNIDKFLEQQTGLTIHKAKVPEITTIKGLKKIYEKKDYNKFIFSM